MKERHRKEWEYFHVISQIVIEELSLIDLIQKFKDNPLNYNLAICRLLEHSTYLYIEYFL